MREGFFGFFRSKLMTSLAMSFCLMGGLVGCGCQEKIGADKKLHFYMVLAPISEEAIKTSKVFLRNARDNGDDENEKTQIILPGPNYTVAEICEGDDPQTPTPMTSFSNANDIDSVTGGVEKSLTKIINEDKKCTASPAALVNLSKKLLKNAAAQSDQNGELVVLIQVPWSQEQMNEEVWKKLKENMTDLAKTNKVKRIIIWGVDPSGAPRLGQAFQAFNESSHIFDSVGDAAIVNSLKTIRRDILQVQCK